MTTLREAVRWRALALGGDATSTHALHLGEVGSDGPLALLCAGLHGDEAPWGAAAIARFLAATPLADLRGRLRLIPAANPNALSHDARCAPLDSLDLNRLFPGDEHGSHSERLAAIITAEALTDAACVIDIHGGGSWCVNHFVHQDAGERVLSSSFGAAFAARMPERADTLTGYAKGLGKSVVAVEMGGRSAREGEWIAQLARGLRRALGRVGVLDRLSEKEPPPPPREVRELRVLRPANGGLFEPFLGAAAVGTVVRQDELLGRLRHPATLETLQEFVAPFENTALLLLRPHLAALEAGALIYVLGRLD